MKRILAIVCGSFFGIGAYLLFKGDFNHSVLIGSCLMGSSIIGLLIGVFSLFFSSKN